MKRVLIISYYWPPTGGSGVQRWVKFSKYLPQCGWQPVVYTPQNPERLAYDESLLADIPSQVEVLKTPIHEPYDIYRRLTGAKPGSNGGQVNPINAQKKSFKQKVSLFIRGNFFIPDPRVWWVSSSVRYLRKYLKEHPVDVIVSSGPPHSMHLIARGLHRKTNIPWIADFRDPWTRMFYFKNLSLTPFSERIHHRLEKSVLDEADAVIAVSPLVRDDFAEMTATKVHLLTNGYDEADYVDAESIKPEYGRFTLVHAGLFASDGNPTVLWRILRQMCDESSEFDSALQIRLAGKTDAEILASIKEAGLGDKLVDLGYCPHNQVVTEQLRAWVLLLPLRKDPEYRKVLPGKIFECVASGRPVLGIGQSDGAAATILSQTKAGVMCDWEDEEGMREYIKKSWAAYCAHDFKSSTESASRYSRLELAKELSLILENL